MAAHQSLLPKVPGLYQSHREIKDRYPIGSEMKIIEDVRFVVCPEKKKSSQVCDQDVAMAMLAKDRDVANMQNWLIFDDKEVLTFDAHYKDIPRYATKTEYHLRELKIIYFLIDETIQVNEPMKHNSGSPQGCFIKKQRIPLPGSDRATGPFYRLLDLVVGGTVVFYGKELRITGVDEYTRDFLVKMGVDVPENEPAPHDPYFTYRKNSNLDYERKCKPSLHQNHASHGYGNLVLKFRGYWDNRYEESGQLHFYDVLYHLIDDTMELSEEWIDDNDVSGKVRHKKFVSKQKLPKASPWSKSPGHDLKAGILNIITLEKKTYFKMDSLALDGEAEPYYKCTDLYIGAVLNVFNRHIVLAQCDEFTQEFYRNVYGMNDFTPLKCPKTLREIKEDMLHEQRQEIILRNYDEVSRKQLVSQEGTGVIFVFLVKMVTEDPINRQRDFLLKYYLDDTKFALYEFRQANSGIRGGMFRYRRKHSKKQDQSKSFVFNQLFVGATIFFDDFVFTVTDVDDKSLRIMINYPKQFPHSDLKKMNKLARGAIDERFSSLEEFRTKHFQDRSLVDREEFRNIMSFDGALDPHAAVVLSLAHKRPDPFEPYSDDTFRSVVQDTMRREMFIHFDGLKNNLRVRRGGTGLEEGLVDREQSIKAMKSNKVPLSEEMRTKLLNRFTDAESGHVHYADMVDFMDYVTDPTKLPTGLSRELLFVKPKKVWVRVDQFINALQTPEET